MPKYERFRDILVLATKNGRIKISAQGTYTPREMQRASKLAQVLAEKTHAKEKNGD